MVSHFTKNIYFKELSNKRILSKEEQLDLARKIDELKKKLDKAKSVKEQESLQEKIRAHRNHLIESCYFMVVKIAKKYRNRYLSLFDLIEEGNLSLIKAIDTFDYRKNIKFSTYVAILVKNQILTVIAHRGKMTHKKSYQYGSWNFASITSPGQAPFRTFTKQLGVDSSKMLKAIKNLQQVELEHEQSLDQDVFDKFFFSHHPVKSTPELDLFQKAIKENIKKINKILTPRENEIIVKYYGLDETKPKRYNVIAKEMNLTSERIRQIHNQAIEKIKKSDMFFMLKDFLSDN